MPQPTLLTLSVASAIVLAAAVAQSLTGFGFALVCVPLLVLVVAPLDSIPVSLILGAVMNILALSARSLGTDRDARGQEPNRTKLDWWLVGGALCGIPLGSLVLARFDPGSLRLLVGITGAISAIIIGSGRTWRIRRPRLVAVGVGLLSGVLNSSTSMGGVPVALFMANRRPGKHAFRDYLLLYILLVNLVAIAVFIASGLLAITGLRLSLLLAPAMLVGFALGTWLFSRVSTPLFTKISVSVVVLTSSVAVLTALIGRV